LPCPAAKKREYAAKPAIVCGGSWLGLNCLVFDFLQNNRCMQKLFDVHTHLLEGNISHYFVASGYCAKTNEEVMQKILQYEKGYFSLGLAPQEVQREEKYPDVQEAVQKFEMQVKFALADAKLKKKLVAIGEVGLDKHWGKTPAQRERQFEAFEKVIHIAKKQNLPLVIHSRDAENECMRQLAASGCKKVLMHCFGGKIEDAKMAAELGWLISIPPRKNSERKKIIKEFGIENFVVESDAPYIAKNNEGALESAKMIAKYKEIPLDEALEKTFENAKGFFNV